MKSRKFKRTIKPEDGKKGKPRSGVVEIHNRTPETYEELVALRKEEDNTLGKLQNIIDVAEEYLKSTKYFSAEEDIKEQEIDPRIEEGGPEHHAISAIRFSLKAISRMEAGDTELAVQAAMGASYNDVMLWFTHKWEPITARAISQTPKPPEAKRKHWAVLLADDLVQQGYTKFPAAWNSISEDDGGRYDGLEVYRNGEHLVAEKHGEADRLTKESFRTGYYQKQKKKK